MSDGACNYCFGGPAMKPHRDRLKWNIDNILDFRSINPHNKQGDRKAYQDLFPSVVNIPIGYARLCPEKAGKVQFIIGLGFLISAVVNIGLAVVLCL